MKLVNYCNKIIEYGFYSLFLFVPLLFSQYTSELFELNKMWATYGISILIMGAWFTKMTVERRISVTRTIFDIPILLFLASQIIATLLSMDQRISFYGYYSRFNGGLLSTITFIFLYYAFVSNLSLKHVWKSLSVTLIAGTIVALWGFPSHFGSDPTCLLFRGTLDTSCWTEAFHPTVRIFSTLGQPAWLAAYMALLIPLAIAYLLKHDSDSNPEKKNLLLYSLYFLIALLFYADLLFANTRAGFIGFLFAYIFFWMVLWVNKLKKENSVQKIVIFCGYALANIGLLYATYSSHSLIAFVSTVGFLLLLVLLKRVYLKTFLLINISFLIISIMTPTPIGNIRSGIESMFSSPQDTEQQAQITEEPVQQAGTVLDTNITDSGNIRKIVWKGAIDVWKSRPLFGTGVETYAFAYYQFRPQEHNLTSEWDYLYNKAHNEFLNYLATTGLFGLGSYLAIIGVVLFLLIKHLLFQKNKPNDQNQKNNAVSMQDNPTKYIFSTALFAGFISILVTNFFGFSVVIINLYFFLIPVFLLFLLGKVDETKQFVLSFSKNDTKRISPYQWTVILLLVITCIYLLLATFRTWRADKAFALGYNLNRFGDFENAYLKLSEAIQLRPSEPVFKDEFAITNATIASALFEQKDATNAAQFANQAIALSNQVTTGHPNNILFWKNKFKVYYLMAAGNPPEKDIYQKEAIASLEKVISLAPTDAKSTYNLGILYRDNGQPEKAAETFAKAVALKPNYSDAYLALGLSYRDLAINENGVITDTEMQQKAVDIMQSLIKMSEGENKEAQKHLQEWNVLGASDSAISN